MLARMRGGPKSLHPLGQLFLLKNVNFLHLKESWVIILSKLFSMLHLRSICKEWCLRLNTRICTNLEGDDGHITRGVHSLLYFAYTCVRDLFIEGVIHLAKKNYKVTFALYFEGGVLPLVLLHKCLWNLMNYIWILPFYCVIKPSSGGKSMVRSCSIV